MKGTTTKRRVGSADGVLWRHIQTLNAVTQRGARQGANDGLKPQVPAPAIDVAVALVESSPIVPLLEQWSQEDRAGRRPGGRPPDIQFRPFIIAMIVCALSGVPVRYDQIRFLLAHEDLTVQQRRDLGLPVDPDPEIDARLNHKRRALTVTTALRDACGASQYS